MGGYLIIPIQDYYNKTATIVRLVESGTNEYGEPIFDEVESESFNCALQPDKGDYTVEEGGEVITSTHRVYCNMEVEASPGDYLKCEGIKYQIMSTLDDAGRDIGETIAGETEFKDWRTFQRIPMFGKFYYWWFGGGKKITERQEEKARTRKVPKRKTIKRR